MKKCAKVGQYIQVMVTNHYFKHLSIHKVISTGYGFIGIKCDHPQEYVANGKHPLWFYNGKDKYYRVVKLNKPKSLIKD